MQNVFSLVMLAGILAFLLCWILGCAGLPVERLTLVSARLRNGKVVDWFITVVVG